MVSGSFAGQYIDLSFHNRLFYNKINLKIAVVRDLKVLSSLQVETLLMKYQKESLTIASV